MKNIFRTFCSLLVAVALFTACTPADHEMGAIASKSDLKFSITQSSTNPNKIILKSLTEGVIPHWITPVGRSTRASDTIVVAFPGKYKFVYGALTDGGYVEADTFNLTITTIDKDYVSGPLWTNLAGGYGNEKTWVLDLDATGKSVFFDGPLYFYGTACTWDYVTDGVKPDGDNWNWNPGYSSNTWLMGATDFGTMTFNLKNGANVIVNHKSIASLGTQTGTFNINATNHTLKMSDAGILHDSGRNGGVKDWGDVRILSLTADHMQLAALRDPVLSGEGACLLVYNFVSKAYYDAHK